MALHKIIRLGSPLLREKSLAIPENELQSAEIKKIIRDMIETMETNQGAGLAAIQISILKRIVVINQQATDRYPQAGEPEPETEKEKKKPLVLINPQIIDHSQELQDFWEGCLSIPDMRGLVARPATIEITYNDQQGNLCQRKADAFEAIVIQHEIDHLNGILYVDRLKNSRLFGYNEELDEALQNKEAKL